MRDATNRRQWIAAAMALTLLVIAPPTPGEDWPEFRGPRRDGVSKETNLLDSWPEAGPPKLWEAEVGVGGGSCSIVDGRVYVMGAMTEPGVSDRRAPRMDSLLCLRVSDGKELWRTAIDQPTRERTYHSPHVTPTVAGGKVYTASRAGKLACVDAASGKIDWTVDTRALMGAADHSFYGYSCSPLVVDGRVIVLSRYGKDLSEAMRKKLLTASQRRELEAIAPERRLRFFWRVRTSMLAFDARGGELAWRTRPVRGSTRNDLASPIMGSFAGQATIVWPTGTQLVGVRPDDGDLLWQFDYAEAFDLDKLGPSHANVMPLIVGDRIIGNLWNHKASNRTFCVRVGADGPQLQWQTPLMVSWYHGYVAYDGMVLGVDNQGVYKGQGPNLPATRPEDIGICQSYDLKSGRVLWHTNEIGATVTGKRVHTSRPAYIVADGKLILQNHRSVSMLKIDRDGAKVVGMVDNLGRGRAYSLPALSDGRLYIRRTSGPLYCFDIREKPE